MRETVKIASDKSVSIQCLISCYKILIIMCLEKWDEESRALEYCV